MSLVEEWWSSSYLGVKMPGAGRINHVPAFNKAVRDVSLAVMGREVPSERALQDLSLGQIEERLAAEDCPAIDQHYGPIIIDALKTVITRHGALDARNPELALAEGP